MQKECPQLSCGVNYSQEFFRGPNAKQTIGKKWKGEDAKMSNKNYTSKKAYERYLKTAIWLDFRNRQLSARPLCERGCGRRSQVLHHSPEAYQHLGHERPQECEALCHLCHDIIHGVIPANDNEPLPVVLRKKPA